MTVSIRADRVRREPVEYLWQERIPRGMISLVAGPPGQGKSLFAYFLAAEASRSETVLYSTQEESLRKTARARLEAAGATLSQVHFWTPELPRDLDRLFDKIVENDAGLVVLDPVAAHLAVSIYNDQDVRRALSPLKDVAEETNAAILLISHTTKRVAKGAHPMDAIGGAGGGLRAAARIAFLFGRNPDDADERLLACVKSNIAPEPATFAFEIDVDHFDDTGEVAYLVEAGERGDSVADARIMIDLVGSQAPPDAKRSAACEFLIKYLRFGPRPAKELREDSKQYGHKWATIRRAADELGVIKPRGGPNSTWALPQALLDELDGEDTDA
jgi:RecA/RadA recombinase